MDNEHDCYQVEWVFAESRPLKELLIELLCEFSCDDAERFL